MALSLTIRVGHQFSIGGAAYRLVSTTPDQHAVVSRLADGKTFWIDDDRENPTPVGNGARLHLGDGAWTTRAAELCFLARRSVPIVYDKAQA